MTGSLQDVEFLKYLKSDSNDFEFQKFSHNFYIYLKCNEELDFIINLESACEFLGYLRKTDAKRFLVNNFEENVDYIQEKVVFEVNPKGGKQLLTISYLNTAKTQQIQNIC